MLTAKYFQNNILNDKKSETLFFGILGLRGLTKTLHKGEQKRVNHVVCKA